MPEILYEREQTNFTFESDGVIEMLHRLPSDNIIKETIRQLTDLTSSAEQQTRIPSDHEYFRHITIDLLKENKGSAFCKRCHQSYSANQLKPIEVGHGKSPFSMKHRQKGIIKNLFGKKSKPPGMFGGKGYACPKGHELISVITWMA